MISAHCYYHYHHHHHHTTQTRGIFAEIASCARSLVLGPVRSISPCAARRTIPARRSKIASCSSHSLQARVSSVAAPRSSTAPAQVPPKTSFSRPAEPVRPQCALSDSPPVLLPPPFLLHDAAQIVSHLQRSRAPPPSSVPWSRQALPLSRDFYHIVPLSHLSTTRPRWTTSP